MVSLKRWDIRSSKQSGFNPPLVFPFYITNKYFHAADICCTFVQQNLVWIPVLRARPKMRKIEKLCLIMLRTRFVFKESTSFWHNRMTKIISKIVTRHFFYKLLTHLAEKRLGLEFRRSFILGHKKCGNGLRYVTFSLPCVVFHNGRKKKSRVHWVYN